MSTITGVKNRLGALSLAHLANDWYMNYPQTILPLLVVGGLPLGRASLLISAFTTSSSLTQPVFGYLVDRKNQHWLMYIGTLWMAVLLGLLGLFQNYAFMLVAAALAGLGTAAFHPQASAMVSALAGKRKGFTLALFVAAGNVGWALTPLLAVPFINRYGIANAWILAVPGVLVAFLLRLCAPAEAKPAVAASAGLPQKSARWGEVAKLMIVVACRSLCYFGLIAFLPLYLRERGFSLGYSSRLVFIMLFSGALGGLAGGFVSDKTGRKAVIAGSLLAAGPLFWLFMATNGALSYVLLGLAGAALLASFSVTVVLTQELIGSKVAMASGLSLGFGIGMGGLGVGIVGFMAQSSGLSPAIHMLILLPIAAGLMTLTINEKSPA